MFIGFFWSCYHRLSLHPWLKALSTCDFQSPKVLLWPMGLGGIRPRSQGGKCRGDRWILWKSTRGKPCRVGISLCASWFLNMKPFLVLVATTWLVASTNGCENPFRLKPSPDFLRTNLLQNKKKLFFSSCCIRNYLGYCQAFGDVLLTLHR